MHIIVLISYSEKYVFILHTIFTIVSDYLLYKQKSYDLRSSLSIKMYFACYLIANVYNFISLSMKGNYFVRRKFFILMLRKVCHNWEQFQV